VITPIINTADREGTVRLSYNVASGDAVRKITSHLVVALGVLGLSSCGAHSERHVVSITVSPATASAQDFPNGKVQFTASATFDKPPSPVVLNPATWVIQPPPNPPDAVSIDQNGVAQCKAGFAGTVMIEGGQTQCPDTAKDACIFKSGSAQLSCP
jgi:hypothetical protein